MFSFCPHCAQPLKEREIADDAGARMRPACPDASCGFVHWQNPTPAVGALIEHEGEIVLARGAGWPEGFFALVTGYLEQNEDPVKAVAREVKEETNLDVIETHIIGNYIFERKNEVMLCYHVVTTGEIKLSPELVEYQRYQPHELRPWPRATGFAVADWMRSRGLPVKFLDRPPIQNLLKK
ncbi:MAG: NUDIX domain-containing protein [Betaproteobacteria bacterium]|nr:NUDIX domain-containing protein [Betaproteobacteria bacterium]